jgi:hypothetical protein
MILLCQPSKQFTIYINDFSAMEVCMICRGEENLTTVAQALVQSHKNSIWKTSVEFVIPPIEL